jgi:hypothetical protein
LLTLISFAGVNFAVAKNQVFSASLGVLCALASQKEFLTEDFTDFRDKNESTLVAVAVEKFRSAEGSVIREEI